MSKRNVAAGWNGSDTPRVKEVDVETANDLVGDPTEGDGLTLIESSDTDARRDTEAVGLGRVFVGLLVEGDGNVTDFVRLMSAVREPERGLREAL